MKPLAIKREEADKRKAEYDALSIDAKIERAKKNGGQKELARLLKLKEKK